MVGTLAQLQLKLYWRAIRRSTGAIVVMVVATLYGLGALSMAMGGVRLLRGLPVADRATLLTAVFAVVVVLRLFALFMTGQEQSLDPARFALLPLRAKQLQPGLLAAAFCTPGAWFLLAVVVESVLVFADHPLLAVLALVCGLLGLVFSTLLNKVVVGLLSGLLHRRKFRDLISVVVMLLAVSSGIIIQGFVRSLELAGSVERVRPLVRILAWTPFGWPWAIIEDAARSDWLLAGVRLVLVVAAGAALWWLWGRLLATALTSPLEAGGGTSTVRSGSLADRLTPQTPGGALAARTLRYYRRDPRHVMQLIVMVMLPFIMIAPTLLGQDSDGIDAFGRGALVLPVFAALMVGSTTVAQEISLDGSALWMQIVAGLPGRTDRWARLYAFLLLAVPLILVIDVAFALLTHQPDKLLVIIGSSLGALAASSAVGTVAGALVQTPQPPPGSSPFARGSSGGPAAVVMVFASLIVSGILVAPFAIAGIVVWNRALLSWVPLAMAIVLAPLLLWGACVLGGRVLDRTWPEVLKRVTYEKA